MPDEMAVLNSSDNVRFYVRIAKEGNAGPFERFSIGRLGMPVLREKVGPLLETLSIVYPCGPQRMYKEVASDLCELGVGSDKIFYL